MSFLNAYTSFFSTSLKKPCFEFLQMFNSQTAQQRYLFSGSTLLADETMLRISGTAWILHRACTDPYVALWVLFMFIAGGLWIHCLRTAIKYFPAPSLYSSSLFFPIHKVRFMYGAHCFCQRKGFILWRACVVSGQHAMTYLVLVAQGFK